MEMALSQCPILVVDDEQHNVNLLERILHHAGFEYVISTTNPVQTVDLFQHHQPDLLLLDLDMPIMDGYDVMVALQNQIPIEDCNIIVVTALNSKSVRREVLSTGAQDFINKPVDRIELLTRIRNHLHTRLLYKRLTTRNQELAKANSALGALNQSMSELVSIVSHELRTPLTAIKSFAEILRDDHDNLSSEERRHFLTIIDNESDRLGRLISDLLDLQKIQSGNMSWKTELIDLIPTIHDTIEFFGPSYADKGLSLSITNELDKAPVLVDTDKLRQVLSNLLSNALKFTERGGIQLQLHCNTHWAHILLVSDTQNINHSVMTAARNMNTSVRLIPNIEQALMQLHAGGGQIDLLIYDIDNNDASDLEKIRKQFPALPATTIGHNDQAGATETMQSRLELMITDLANIAPTQPMVELSIRDTGRGIPTGQLSRVFDRFHQVDISQTREQRGAGLGLTICQQIVQHYHGKLWVESKEGEGSTFHLLLPIVKKEKKRLGEILIEEGLLTEQQLTDALKNQ